MPDNRPRAARYRAAVIGCGSIGGGLDSPGERTILTHAHAYSVVPDFQLVACCDPRPAARRDFMGRWGRSIRTYADFRELLVREAVDVLSICSDTASHAQVLLGGLAQPGLRAIVCEKPLVQSRSEMTAVTRALAAHPEKRLFVNFTRRYDPAFDVLEDRVRRRADGKLLAFAVVFNKGLYHNGCHALELLERLFGPVRLLRAASCQEKHGDFFGDFYVETSRGGRGTVSAVLGLRSSLFEMDLFFEKGRVRISEGGMRIESFRERASKAYPGYREMAPQGRWGGTLAVAARTLIERVRAQLRSAPDRRLLQAHLGLSDRLLVLRDGLRAGKREIRVAP